MNHLIIGAGPAKGKVTGLDKMLPEYYSLRGWTTDGQLTAEVREKFALPA